MGKPVRLLNEVYRIAAENDSVSLTIVTGLTLTTPDPGAELARRLLGPIMERLSGGGPEPAWEADRRAGALPPNIEIRDFYLTPGASVSVPGAQQSHVSANYHHVADQLADLGVNALAQMVSPPGDGIVSLGTNPDLSVRLLEQLERRRASGESVAIVAEIADEMPRLRGQALVDGDRFDVILEQGGPSPLFGIPNPPIGKTETALGCLAAALVRDGGTLQLGIGALGDAVAAGLDLRQRDHAGFGSVVAELAGDADRVTIDSIGGTEEFSEGLYVASELLSDGLLALHDRGVVSREVATGVMMHAAFAAGSPGFYEQLRDRADSLPLEMTDVGYTNTLLATETLKREQRKDARFINASMQLTCLGEAASDTLDDGRVVSGVGGQHDFVTQAHDLEGARSIIVARATRTEKGRIRSNIVWKHGHPTIPRHLRDVFVTEYGIADVRGKTDAETIAALIGISDARFHESLVRKAKDEGKLPKGWEVPPSARDNSPRRVDRAIDNGIIPRYPFGSVLTDVEDDLRRSLSVLSEVGWRPRSWPSIASLWAGIGRPAEAMRPHLRRLGLEKPENLRDRVMAAAVAAGLEESGVFE